MVEGGTAAASTAEAVSPTGVGESRWRSIQQAFVVGPVSRFTALYFDEEIAEDREDKPGPRDAGGGWEGGEGSSPAEPRASDHRAGRAELERVLQETRQVVARKRAADQVSGMGRSRGGRLEM